MNGYVLKLYIAGLTARSERALTNLRRLCQQRLDNSCDIIVVDVLEHPQIAEDEKILATPMLVREEPPPHRRVIGDLSDEDAVLSGLGVVEK